MSGKPNISEIKKTIERIKNINLKIYSKSVTEKENYFFDNHPDIMNNYPSLVSQICSGADLDKLDYMIKGLEIINSGEKSREDMDKVIGEKLADEYIKPHDKPNDNNDNNDK